MAQENEQAVRYLIQEIVSENDPERRRVLLGELEALLKTESKPEVARLIQRVQFTFAPNNAKPPKIERKEQSGP